MKHKIKSKKVSVEEDIIENVIKQSDQSKKEKIIRNLLVLVDLLLEDLDLNIKFDNSRNVYTAKLRKIMLGAVKGINKHKEIHFISIIYEIELIEYIQINPNDLLYYNKFKLLFLKKFFINLKLEYGLFPKSQNSLFNTINFKSELSEGNIDLSSRSLDTLFSFIVSLFLIN